MGWEGWRGAVTAGLPVGCLIPGCCCLSAHLRDMNYHRGSHMFFCDMHMHTTLPRRRKSRLSRGADSSVLLLSVCKDKTQARGHDMYPATVEVCTSDRKHCFKGSYERLFYVPTPAKAPPHRWLEHRTMELVAKQLRQLAERGAWLCDTDGAGSSPVCA